MPPRKRKATDDDYDNATQSVQSSQSLAAAASPLSPEETEKLANELCRYGAWSKTVTQTPLARLGAHPLATHTHTHTHARHPIRAARQS
jgi:hypothetical protein